MCALKEKGVDMAIASRSPTPDIARVFIDKLDLQPMFVAQVKLVTLPYPELHYSFLDAPEFR
jgi:magnesium-dependent phosphatase 1